MYTQCRGCGEVFVVEVDHLVHARGQVRCNLCGTVFDGLETLSAQKPHEDEDLLLHDFDNAPPLLTQAHNVSPMTEEPEDLEDLDELDDPSEPIIPDQPIHYNQQEQELEQAIQNDEAVLDFEAELDDIIAEALANPDEEEDPLPDFVAAQKPVADVPFMAEKQGEKSAKNAGLMWAALSLAVVVCLLWQAQRAIAAGQITLPENEFGEQACQYLKCAQTTETVDLNAISLVSRNIRPHPGRDAALIISASMINANENSSAYPALEIKLSDLNGDIVAMRRFLATEYLPADALKAGFMANTLIPINLEIVSPGDNAVAFEIGFTQP